MVGYASPENMPGCKLNCSIICKSSELKMQINDTYMHYFCYKLAKRNKRKRMAYWWNLIVSHTTSASLRGISKEKVNTAFPTPSSSMCTCRIRINDCSYKDRKSACNKNTEPGSVRWQVIFSPIPSERAGWLLHFKIIFLFTNQLLRPRISSQLWEEENISFHTERHNILWRKMHQKSQGSLQSGALIWTHSSLHFFICSGIAVSPWSHIDPPFSYFSHFPTSAWLTGTSFYNFIDLWYQWHPPFTECKAEWISSEKKMKQWWSASLQGAHSISDHVKYQTTSTQGKILNRGIWKCVQTTHISSQKAFANLYLICKTKICIGFLAEHLSIFCKMMRISKRKMYSCIDSLEEKA